MILATQLDHYFHQNPFSCISFLLQADLFLADFWDLILHSEPPDQRGAICSLFSQLDAAASSWFAACVSLQICIQPPTMSSPTLSFRQAHLQLFSLTTKRLYLLCLSVNSYAPPEQPLIL